MNTVVKADLPGFQSGWLSWWRQEMRPFPGRLQMTVRMVVTVALVTLISMALQVPQVAFSCFFALFVTKENRVLTMLTGVFFCIGATIATAVTLVLYNGTFDHPEWRLPVTAGFIFLGMFLARTFVIGQLGFIIGFLSALMQTVAEEAPNTDALVRGQLWLWLAIIYPVALSVIINQILLPADPWVALVQSLNLRLDAARTALQRIVKTGSAGGQNNPALLDLATRASGVMLGLLNFAETKNPQLKRRHPFLVETVAAAANVATATASLEFREQIALSPDDIDCASGLLVDLAELKTALPEPNRVLAARPIPPKPATLPQLRELQFAVESARDSLIRGASDYSSVIPANAKKPLFSPDAFTNPSHLRFALKVTLAAMICYLVYSGLNWPGINTAFVTCCFVALGNTGATIYKSWLRFFGCLGGGLLGYLVIFFLVPRMESITSLVLLIAAMTALFGWIAAGTERIAYAGLQAAFAFYLAVFQGFEPGTNLTTIRDRVAGILLGTVASALVFQFVWPEHAADNLRKTLERVLNSVSKLLLIPKPGVPVEADGKTALSLHRILANDLDNILALSEQAAVEDITFRNPKTFSPAVLKRLTAHIQALCLITTALWRRTKLEEWHRLKEPVQETETALRSEMADYLRQVADFVHTARPPKECQLDRAYEAWNQTTQGVTDNDRPRLVRRLVNQVRELV